VPDSVVAADEKNTVFEGYLRIEDQQNPGDFDVIPITLKTPTELPIGHWSMLSYILWHWIQHHPGIQRLWNLLPY